jgi:hypothetical protein
VCFVSFVHIVIFVSFSFEGHVKCLEAYPTLHKVRNHPDGLYYSDHLAVYARLEIDDNITNKTIETVNTIDTLDEHTKELLRSANVIIDESVQRIQQDRIFWAFALVLLTCLLFSFNSQALSSGYLWIIFTIVKNLLSLIGITICIWFVCLGKPVEHNALRAIQNAMRIRLQAAQFFY